jgi:ribokinase
VWFEPISIAKCVRGVKSLKAKHLDYISPNHLEVIAMLKASGHAVEENEHEQVTVARMFEFAKKLHQVGAKNCVLKMGSQGVVVSTVSPTVQTVHIPAVKIPVAEVVSVTGAGDTLNGTIISGLLRGLSLVEAAKIAVKAAALTVKSRFAIAPELSQIDIWQSK